MRRIISGLLVVLCFMGSITTSLGENFMPKIGDVIGVEMPSFRAIAFRKPDHEEYLDDGTINRVFEHIDEQEYDKWNQYLEESGCSLISYEIEGSKLTAVLSKSGKEMSFIYDNQSLTMSVMYSAGTYEESSTKKIKAGSEVLFGRYQQNIDYSIDYDGSASIWKMYDPEPIEWIVLDVKDGKALLLSKYSLDAGWYDNRNYGDITWEECTMRSWLNSGFINTAFSSAEQSAILKIVVDNSPNKIKKDEKYYDTLEGNNTKDKIFLLSYSDFPHGK